MTHTEALNLLDRRIAEVHAKTRGFISRPSFNRETGCKLSIELFCQIGRDRGLDAYPHGKYGWCLSLPRKGVSS